MSLVLDGTNGVTYPTGNLGNGLVSGTAQASTSGTSIDFTGIPSWVKRITVMFNGVSTSGTSPIQIQIGAGSVSSSGYTSSANYLTTSTANQTATSGFILFPSGAGEAAQLLGGLITIATLGSNLWSQTSILGKTQTSAGTLLSAGYTSLSGLLDRVRITTVNGTDTFDAGSINILYE
jgi:hypothetical protein